MAPGPATSDAGNVAVAALAEKPASLEPTSARRSSMFHALGFAALGAVAGMSLGLSASPIIGATITAGFALVGTLVPLYLRDKAAADLTAKSPPPTGDWLFPFALCLGLGMLVGITIRVNDALNFQSTNLRDKYRKEGFSEKQIDVILDGIAKEIAAERTPEKADAVSAQKSNLQAAKIPANIGQSLDLVRDLRVEGKPATPEQKLDHLKRLVPADFLVTIKKWQSHGFDAQSILNALERRTSLDGE